MLYANCLTSQNGLVDICLIRHTRPQIEAGICYGRLDLDLAKGFEQEAVLAAAVLPSGFQHVYSSPLQRCRKLADYLGFNYRLDDRLRELDFGDWEGRSWAEISESSFKDWTDNVEAFIFPGGESFAEFQARVEQFLSQLPGGRTLLITHAGVIKVAYGMLAGKPLNEATAFAVEYGQCLRVVDGLPSLLPASNRSLLSPLA